MARLQTLVGAASIAGLVSFVPNFWYGNLYAREFRFSGNVRLLCLRGCCIGNDCDAGKNMQVLIRRPINLSDLRCRLCRWKICIDSRWVTITLNLLVVRFAGIGFSFSELEAYFGETTVSMPLWTRSRVVFCVTAKSTKTFSFWWMVLSRSERCGKLKPSLRACLGWRVAEAGLFGDEGMRLLSSAKQEADCFITSPFRISLFF